MKIVKAETRIVEIPFELEGSGVGIMPTTWSSLEFCLVRLEDERGNVGWGEGFGYFTVDATKALIDRLILPTLIGVQIDDIPEWNRQTQRRIHMFGRYGVTMFAIGGVDIALWDLLGKREGKPVRALLGGRGAPRDAIPLYACLIRYDDRALVTAACRGALADGFTDLKLHEVDLDLIEACRETVGPDVPLAADVNCGWSPEFVVANEGRIAALDLAWLEEPVFPPEDFATLKALRGRPARVAAGENWCTAFQCQQALQAGAVDIFQPSVTKIGGLSVYLDTIDAAVCAGIRTLPHSPYFGPGLFASLHAAAARPEIEALEWNWVKPDAWLADVESLRDGSHLRVPDTPGLGFAPDPDVLKRYSRQPR